MKFFRTFLNVLRTFKTLQKSVLKNRILLLRFYKIWTNTGLTGLGCPLAMRSCTNAKISSRKRTRDVFRFFDLCSPRQTVHRSKTARCCCVPPMHCYGNVFQTRYTPYTLVTNRKTSGFVPESMWRCEKTRAAQIVRRHNTSAETYARRRYAAPCRYENNNAIVRLGICNPTKLFGLMRSITGISVSRWIAAGRRASKYHGIIKFACLRHDNL